MRRWRPAFITGNVICIIFRIQRHPERAAELLEQLEVLFTS